jgi:glycosyltransferase involved in cell wall biosynthesis
MSFFNSGKNSLSKVIKYLSKHWVIKGYDEYCSEKRPRKALLSYLVLPLLPPPPFRDRVQFSNRGIAQEIPRVLNELGYKVDIINFDNEKWRPSPGYDLFIGHGGINFSRISKIIGPRIPKIYFATGIHWKELNIRMARRLYDLALRRGVLLPPERYANPNEEKAYEIADGIICLGGEGAAQTFKGSKCVIGINNAVYSARGEYKNKKDYFEGKYNFLFFSGRGNIQKGLDLLVESFAQCDLNLHICTHLQNKFLDTYREELFHRQNIHIYGFIKMRSKQFFQLIKKCDWVISPSCAEGQPGAILEAMAFGLIPILSRSNNINVGDLMFLIDNCKIESICKVAALASCLKAEDIKYKSDAIRSLIEKEYSVEKFRSKLRDAIERILKTKNETRDI